MGQRQHFFEALARVVLANPEPLLLVLDDLHWCDSETLEWLRYLLHFAPQAKLLLVVTVRSGETAADHPLHTFLLSLRRERRLTEIPLERLTQADTAALAAQVAGQALANEQVVELYRQTEGNPLFVVEMVHSITTHRIAGSDTARNAGGLAATASVDTARVTLPDSLQALIQARLSRLTSLANEVVQFAAVIGRSFSVDVLAYASGYGDDELMLALDELWQRHILHEQPPNEYDFSHPQIRGVTYRQISPMRRRLLHRRAAEALEGAYPHRSETMSGLIALHYELAGDTEQAIPAYQRAAHFAKQTYAYSEAAQHLRQGLALLSTRAEDDNRYQQELELQLGLGLALMMVKGYADPEAQQAYNRVLELCRTTNTGIHLYEALWALHLIYLSQANGAKAREITELCWRLAQQSGDPELLLQAHHAYWGLCLYAYQSPEGLQAAIDHAQKGIELYDPAWHRTHVLHYAGHDPGMCAFEVKAMALWLLGYPDQAVESAWNGIALAARLGHPFSHAQAYLQTAKVHAHRGELQRVLECLAQVRHIAKHIWPEENPQEVALQGWVQGQLYGSTDAAALIQQGIWRMHKDEFKAESPYFLLLLAETQERSGELGAAQQTVEEALAITDAAGGDYYEPELYRLQGTLLWARGGRSTTQRELSIKGLRVRRSKGPSHWNFVPPSA
jgi:tetratricopeptide (TPR) repeat protein